MAAVSRLVDSLTSVPRYPDARVFPSYALDLSVSRTHGSIIMDHFDALMIDDKDKQGCEDAHEDDDAHDTRMRGASVSVAGP